MERVKLAPAFRCFVRCIPAVGRSQYPETSSSHTGSTASHPIRQHSHIRIYLPVKRSRTLLIISSLPIFAAGFWFYGAGRTMAETVNFTPDGFLCGFLFGALLPLTAILVF